MSNGDEIDAVHAPGNPPLEGHGEMTGYLSVICTDRGAHKRTKLCDVRFYADGYWRMTFPANSYAALPPLDGVNTQYIFDCPRCPRTPQISRDKWVGAMNGRFQPSNWEDGASHAVFDVSLVPF